MGIRVEVHALADLGITRSKPAQQILDEWYMAR